MLLYEVFLLLMNEKFKFLDSEHNLLEDVTSGDQALQSSKHENHTS